MVDSALKPHFFEKPSISYEKCEEACECMPDRLVVSSYRSQALRWTCCAHRTERAIVMGLCRPITLISNTTHQGKRNEGLSTVAFDKNGLTKPKPIVGFCRYGAMVAPLDSLPLRDPGRLGSGTIGREQYGICSRERVP